MAKKKSTRRTSPKKSAAMAEKTPVKKKRASGRREIIDTGHDKRFVRRDVEGQFKESDDMGRSLSSDRRRKVKSGYGDKGDRSR